MSFRSDYIDPVVNASNNSPELMDGLKIRAICDEYNLSLEDAARQSCLFIEIYRIAKRSNGRIIDYVKKHKDMHLKALEVMTDTDRLAELRSAIDSEEISDKITGESQAVSAYRFYRKLVIIDELEKADIQLKAQFGISNFFTSQLENSRRLYTDPEFREQQVALYLSQIEPRLSYYSLDRVADIFEHFTRAEKEKQERIKKQYFSQQ
jgi:hypothetical protein